MRAPPGVQILSISCSFREKLAKSYVGAPPPRGVGTPSSGKSWIRHCVHTAAAKPQFYYCRCWCMRMGPTSICHVTTMTFLIFKTNIGISEVKWTRQSSFFPQLTASVLLSYAVCNIWVILYITINTKISFHCIHNKMYWLQRMLHLEEIQL